MKKNMVIALILIFCIQAWSAEISFKILKGEKSSYSEGDSLKIEINIKYQNKLCDEGINATKIFSKGIKIVHKENWNELTTGHWLRHISLIAKKKQMQLTVIRRTDKESGFGTLKLKSFTTTEIAHLLLTEQNLNSTDYK